MASVLLAVVVVVIAIPMTAFLLAMMAAGVIFSFFDTFLKALRESVVTVVPA
jgi:hypothetical protein